MSSTVEISPKSYGVAVALSGIFGVIGIQHFYLGRWMHGIADFVMTVSGIILISTGDMTLTFIGIGIFLIDVIHTLIVTVMLLVGNFKDGQGRIVAYPGQKFK